MYQYTDHEYSIAVNIEFSEKMYSKWTQCINNFFKRITNTRYRKVTVNNFVTSELMNFVWFYSKKNHFQSIYEFWTRILMIFSLKMEQFIKLFHLTISELSFGWLHQALTTQFFQATEDMVDMEYQKWLHQRSPALQHQFMVAMAHTEVTEVTEYQKSYHRSPH